MAVLRFADLGGYCALDVEQRREAGNVSADECRANDPFPHSSKRECFARDQEWFECQVRPDECEGPATRTLFAEFNTAAFLTFLSELAGIRGLAPDPCFAGARLHQIKADWIPLILQRRKA